MGKCYQVFIPDEQRVPIYINATVAQVFEEATVLATLQDCTQRSMFSIWIDSLHQVINGLGYPNFFAFLNQNNLNVRELKTAFLYDWIEIVEENKR